MIGVPFDRQTGIAQNQWELMTEVAVGKKDHAQAARS
jgi:hypothetical protein